MPATISALRAATTAFHPVHSAFSERSPSMSAFLMGSVIVRGTPETRHVSLRMSRTRTRGRPGLTVML